MVQNIAQRRSANSFATTYSSNFASSLLITANDVDANGKCRRKGVVIWSCSSRAGYFLIVFLALSLLFMILALILSVLGISSTSTTPSYNYSNRNVYITKKKRRGNLNNPGFIDSFEKQRDNVVNEEFIGTYSHQEQRDNPSNDEQKIMGTSNNQIQRQVPRSFSRVSRPISHELDRFPTLSFALQKSELVALYFAAQWCPMSTPVTISLDMAFSHFDLLDSSEMQNGPSTIGEKKTLSVVYVSSDKNLEQYQSYLENKNWLAVPYDSVERTDIQKYFSTCARIEIESLGIDRKHEIPTIIVIDAAKQLIVTTEGAKDVVDMGERALKHWEELQYSFR